MGFASQAGCFFYLFISPIRARYFLLSAQEKVPKEKGSPAALIGYADSLRSSPIRGRAQLAISLRSIRSDRVRALIPEWLRYSVSANG
jgi:hypothetical protein